MRDLLLVGVGGFAGAVARYRLGGAILHHTVENRFPFATFAVNLLGCLFVGLLAGWGEARAGLPSAPSPELRLLLITGFCGGFTTFSAFGLETVYLLRRDAWMVASLNVLVSVAGGIAGVWVGWRLLAAAAR
ncbi:MAG TPA: fluoride efflux transporter CrcB [Gemmatimonadales bacterium]|nr:fluoride efflux transporter CrcB [Gemmatimonadales bacterium]